MKSVPIFYVFLFHEKRKINILFLLAKKKLKPEVILIEKYAIKISMFSTTN
jgi:hypothetical protein